MKVLPIVILCAVVLILWLIMSRGQSFGKSPRFPRQYGRVYGGYSRQKRQERDPVINYGKVIKDVKKDPANVVVLDRAVARSDEALHRPENAGLRTQVYKGIIGGYNNLLNNENRQKSAQKLPKDTLNNMIDGVIDEIIADEDIQDYGLFMMAQDLHWQQMAWNNRANLEDKKAAKKKSAAKEIKDKIRVSSDPQNVHDTGVVDSAKKLYSDIRADYGDSNPDKAKLRQDVSASIDAMAKSGEISAGVAKKARKALDHIIEADIGIHSLNNDTETQILGALWDNGAKKPNGRYNLVQGLADICENFGNVVCPVGRANKLIGSCAINDEGSTIKTESMIRNEIFQFCHTKLDEILGQYKEEDSPVGVAARQYLTGNAASEASGASSQKASDQKYGKDDIEEAEKNLENNLRDEFHKIVDQYGQDLRPTQRDRIKNEVEAAII